MWFNIKKSGSDNYVLHMIWLNIATKPSLNQNLMETISWEKSPVIHQHSVHTILFAWEKAESQKVTCTMMQPSVCIMHSITTCLWDKGYFRTCMSVFFFKHSFIYFFIHSGPIMWFAKSFSSWRTHINYCCDSEPVDPLYEVTQSLVAVSRRYRSVLAWDTDKHRSGNASL